jgi:hypothetical protein
MKPLTLAVCVAVVAALVVGSCGCTSLLNKQTATPAQASATPSSSSGGISALYLSVLTTNLEKGGYAMVTQFTNTTADGQTIYVASATKGGDTFALTYYPATSSSDASSIKQQQINKYIGLGYVESPNSTSSEWIGLLGSTQGVGVQLLDISPVEGVLVILGAAPSPLPVPTPVPTPISTPAPTPTPAPTYEVQISGFVNNNNGTAPGAAEFAATVTNGQGVYQTLNNQIDWFINGQPAGGTWQPSGILLITLTPGVQYTVTATYLSQAPAGSTGTVLATSTPYYVTG